VIVELDETETHVGLLASILLLTTPRHLRTNALPLSRLLQYRYEGWSGEHELEHLAREPAGNMCRMDTVLGQVQVNQKLSNPSLWFHMKKV
jgi:hypothetical protein